MSPAACIPRRTRWLALADGLAISAGLAGFLLLVSPASPPAATLARVLGMSGALLLCLHYYDLYEARVTADPRAMAPRLAQALGTGCIALALVCYLDSGVRPHQGVLAGGALLVGAVVMGNRRLFWFCNRSARLAERAVLLGQGPLAEAVARALGSRPELGLRLVGALPPQPEISSRLLQLIERERAARVLVAFPPGADALPLATLVELRSRGVRVSDAAVVFEQATAKVALEGLELQWLLSLDRWESTLWRMYHRAIARIVAALALLLLAPLLGLIALAVRLDSSGPAIFRQQRVGRGGRLFSLYKFRSMWRDADRGGAARPAQAGDARITRVGRFLRRCRLDELPQLVNIVRGDLDFVGPRPFVPEQERELVAAIPFYCYRWTVTPGITGWAQIQQGYCATLEDNREKLAFDLFYIKHRSLGLDLVVLFQTVKILLLGRGAR